MFVVVLFGSYLIPLSGKIYSDPEESEDDGNNYCAKCQMDQLKRFRKRGRKKEIRTKYSPEDTKWINQNAKESREESHKQKFSNKKKIKNLNPRDRNLLHKLKNRKLF